MNDSTIAAISTGLTNSGIGIVRISGCDSLKIIDKIFKGKNNKKLSSEKTYTAHYGRIYDGNKQIDEVIVLIMKAPNTYTREDIVEINCHGGVLVMQQILETVIKYGAVPAEPGEFTKRAFLNGRIDLSQAEAVMDVINSKNEYALNNSISILNGKLFNKIEELRSIIINRAAFIESALDDPEHYDLDNFGDKLLIDVDNIINSVNSMLKTFNNGKLISEGINTVIVGKPNAGKSTLLNNLLGEERAIVTDVAGTTRDTLEEFINIDGITLKVIDTAGIRKTVDIVESIGVKKSIDYVDKSDLILYVVDASVKLDDNDYDIINMIKDKNVIVLQNKNDLEINVEENIIKDTFENVINISAKNDIGIIELKEKIKDLFFNGKLDFNDEICITNVRHKKLLNDTLDSMILIKEGINNCISEDLYLIDLMNAYKSLGLIIGKQVDDDLVDEIFTKFCTGK